MEGFRDGSVRGVVHDSEQQTLTVTSQEESKHPPNSWTASPRTTDFQVDNLVPSARLGFAPNNPAPQSLGLNPNPPGHTAEPLAPQPPAPPAVVN